MHVGHARQRGAYTVTGGGGVHGHGGTHGEGAHMHASLMMAAASCHVVGVGRIRARPSLGVRTGGTHGSKKEPIYVLPSSFEVPKPSPPGSLPSTCKVLCFKLWRLKNLALHI
jgi:hypothetical protein